MPYFFFALATFGIVLTLYPLLDPGMSMCNVYNCCQAKQFLHWCRKTGWLHSLAREKEFVAGIQPLELVHNGKVRSARPDTHWETWLREINLQKKEKKMSWSACCRHYQIITGSLWLPLKIRACNHCILLTFSVFTNRAPQRFPVKRSATTKLTVAYTHIELSCWLQFWCRERILNKRVLLLVQLESY